MFGQHFKADTWKAWSVFLAALFGLPMNDEQLELYRKHTGRKTPPSEPFREAWLCIGRRGGKSFVLASIAVFLASFKDWRRYLGPGEYGTVMVIAADRKQARVIMRYAIGLLNAVPMLERQVEGVTRESISLRNRVVIEIHAASFRSTRGYSIVERAGRDREPSGHSFEFRPQLDNRRLAGGVTFVVLRSLRGSGEIRSRTQHECRGQQRITDVAWVHSCSPG